MGKDIEEWKDKKELSDARDAADVKVTQDAKDARDLMVAKDVYQQWAKDDSYLGAGLLQ